MASVLSATTDRRPSAPSTLLRWAIIGDAGVSAACGLLMALGAEPLSGLLGLSAPLLHYAGLALLPYALFLAWLAGRRPMPRAAVWAVIACNLLWAVDCVLLLVLGWAAPTGLGVAFVLVQAVTVLGFAEVQYVGLRQRR